jgi:hypothetical protein
MIKIHNDGKGKSESFEAYSDYDVLPGFGQTEEEAVDNYEKNVKDYISVLQSLDYTERIVVDFNGKEVPDAESKLSVD